MLIPLREATGDRCGTKAGSLAALIRSGFEVPDGFVVPVSSVPPGEPIAETLREAVTGELARMGDAIVAVRSSAVNEDGPEASAAGQYESILGVCGAAEVCEAISACLDSARSGRIAAYLNRSGSGTLQGRPEMAVIVQRLVAADASGVMFTPGEADGPARIEASWGLGLSVVGGIVTPDSYQIATDGTIECSIGRKLTRIDLSSEGSGLVTTPVDGNRQTARVLDDGTIGALVALGRRIAEVFGRPQDVEWAICGDKIWVLQARPITAPLPSLPGAPAPGITLMGIPGADGIATATARIVTGPSDFAAVRPGEIVICPFTDPAWTPLFGFVAGIVTETGGALSHAAIVAREYGIPAVLGVTEARARIRTGDRIVLNGTAGTITVDPQKQPAKGGREITAYDGARSSGKSANLGSSGSQ